MRPLGSCVALRGVAGLLQKSYRNSCECMFPAARADFPLRGARPPQCACLRFWPGHRLPHSPRFACSLRAICSPLPCVDSDGLTLRGRVPSATLPPTRHAAGRPARTFRQARFRMLAERARYEILRSDLRASGIEEGILPPEESSGTFLLHDVPPGQRARRSAREGVGPPRATPGNTAATLRFWVHAVALGHARLDGWVVFQRRSRPCSALTARAPRGPHDPSARPGKRFLRTLPCAYLPRPASGRPRAWLLEALRSRRSAWDGSMVSRSTSQGRRGLYELLRAS
jgi:hypothetical protein